MTDEELELTPQEIEKRTVKSVGALASFGVFLSLITRIRTFLIIPFLIASDFGLKSLAVSIFAFVGMPMWGFGTNVLMEKKDIEQMYSVHTAFIFGFTTIIGFVVILFRQYLANLFDAPLLANILLVTMSANIFFAVGAGAKLKLRREIRQNVGVVISIFSSGLDLFVTVFLAFSGYGVWSLVLGPIAGKTFGTIVIITIIKTPPKRFDWSHIVRYFRGGFNFNMLSFFAVILYNADDLLVGFISGVSNLGYYSLAFGIMLLVSALIVDPITSVTLSAYSRMDSKKREIALQRTLEYTSIFLFGILLIGIFSVKFLIIFFYGEKWLPIANLAQVSLILALVGGLLGIFTNYLMAQNETNLLIRVRIFQIGILLGMGIPLLYYFGPVGMIVAQILHVSVALFIQGKFTGKQFRINLILKSLYPASTAVLLSVSVVSVGSFLFDINTLESVILIVLSYCIGVSLTGRNIIIGLFKLIKNTSQHVGSK